MKSGGRAEYTCKCCGATVGKIIKCDSLCCSCYRKQPRMRDRIITSRKMSSMKREERLEKEGVCIKCKGEKETSYLLCDKCRAKARSRYEIKRDKERVGRFEAGICVTCGKCPPDDGKIACERCSKKYWKVISAIIESGLLGGA